MQKWTFDLEIVTPLFLSGASTKDAELRPPSIKELMRFWYRTCFNTSNLKGSSENEIYGSTENQGKFKPIILDRTDLPTIEFIKYEFPNGIQYFGFPFGLGENRRRYIETGTVFKLQLKYFGNSVEEKKAILASFWLLIWLGGLGTRNRKGFGSLGFIDEPSEDTFGLKFYFNDDASEFKNFFESNLLKAIRWVNPNFMQQNNLPEHTSLICNRSRIYLLTKDSVKNKDFETWEDAVNYAGVIIQEYRNDNRSPDYESVKNLIQSGTVKDGELVKPAWGLPIKYQYRSLFRKYFIEELTNILRSKNETIPQHYVLKEIAKKALGNKERKKQGQIQSKNLGVAPYEYYQTIDEAKNNSTANVNIGYQPEKIENKIEYETSEKKRPDRRSSPLFIKTIKLKNDKYGLLFSFLPAQLLPNNKNLKIKITADNKNFDFIDIPDFSSIEEFLDEKVFENSEKFSF